MATASAQMGAGRPPDVANDAAEPGLVRVVYRSRAASPMSGRALELLVAAAQSRNEAESITGLIVHDRSNFFQWLEGPEDAIERVLESIRNDSRHTGFRLLDRHRTRVRRFDGWSMHHLTRLSGAARSEYSPAALVAALRRAPDEAARAFSSLAPRNRHRPRRPERAVVRILKHVILYRVVPEVAIIHRGGRRVNVPHARTAELASLLAAGDAPGATRLLSDALRGPAGLVPLMAGLVEPAAHMLGDLWAADALAELDVTVGLCCLRTAVRRAAAGALPAPPASRALRVLSTACPGEPHALGPTLHPEAMWQAGWSPTVAAGTEDAMLDSLSAGTFDCLDLSGSATLPCGDHLPQLAATIARARRASRNKAMAVVVGGRDMAGNAGRVGADVAIASAVQVVGAVRRAVADRAA